MGEVIDGAAASAKALLRLEGETEDAALREMAGAAVELAEAYCRQGFAGGAWEALPAPIAHGLAVMTAYLWERRGDAVPPAAVAALWRPYRQLGLGG